jgi:hypothetical protein
MKVRQRDIVNVEFIFPAGNVKTHYAIVVSNNEVSTPAPKCTTGNVYKNNHRNNKIKKKNSNFTPEF